MCARPAWHRWAALTLACVPALLVQLWVVASVSASADDRGASTTGALLAAPGAVFLLGLLATLLVYHLAMYASLRDMAYLIYSGFVGIAASVFLLSRLQVQVGDSLVDLRATAVLVMLACLGQFTRAVLEADAHAPPSDRRMATTCVWMLAAAGLCLLLGSQASQLVAWAACAVFVTVCTRTILGIARSGFPPARLFLGAWVVGLVAMAASGLGELGWLPQDYFGATLRNLAMVGMCLVFALVLAERFGLMRQAVREANDRMMEFHRDKVAAQQALGAVTDRAEGDLQRQVDGRTRELRRITEEAEEARREAEDVRSLEEQARSEAERAHAEAEQARQIAEFAHAQLAEMDEQKTHFFQSVSHELRTPLTLILNPLELAESDNPGDRNIPVARRNAMRLLRLVNQLLDFQKLSAGKQQLSLRSVNLTGFVLFCGDYFASACSTKRIDLKLTVSGEALSEESATEHPIFVRGDVDALEKIVFNYLSNALKYTSDKGSIELMLELSNDGNVRVSVRDDGPGIASDDQVKLFRLFSQVGGDNQVAGTGLGLALVKELAEAMGGVVGVQSEPGEGSTFWFELPLVEGMVEHDEGQDRLGDMDVKQWLLVEGGSHDSASVGLTPANDSDQDSMDSGGPLALVVDDHNDMRDLIAATLRRAGYRTCTAQHGEQGLEVAASRLPDIIVSDWMMPRMTGPQMVSKLRGVPRLRAIPVVLLTARSDTESRIEATQEGADAFLGKPFNEAELLANVRNLLALKEREREIEQAHTDLEEAALREREQSQQMLVQSEKLAALGQLVASVGHEIANPVGFLRMSSEMLRDQLASLGDAPEATVTPEDYQATGLDVPPEQSRDQVFKDMLESVEQQCVATGRLTELSRALRNQARTDAAPSHDVQVGELVQESLVILSGKTRMFQVEQEGGEIPTITCRRSQVGQVITNLVVNACDALSEARAQAREREESFAGKIRVTTKPGAREGQDGLCVQVEDNGPGVPEELRARILEAFFTTKPVGQGTGLGLSLCAAIVQAHGGFLGVDSSPDLGGARFEVWLPLQSALVDPSASSEEDADGTSPVGAERRVG